MVKTDRASRKITALTQRPPRRLVSVNQATTATTTGIKISTSMRTRLAEMATRTVPGFTATPASLLPLFNDLPRLLEVDAATVDEAIERLDEQWPGVRDRLCEPGPVLRKHINVYVDRERAQLDTALEERSRIDVIAAISGG